MGRLDSGQNADSLPGSIVPNTPPLRPQLLRDVLLEDCRWNKRTYHALPHIQCLELKVVHASIHALFVNTKLKIGGWGVSVWIPFTGIGVLAGFSSQLALSTSMHHV